MSVITRRSVTLVGRLAASALLCGSSMLPACAAFVAHKQSTVAQGKYFAAGEPRYDDFFVGLFLLQVEMEQAPHVPDLERLNLAHALGLTPQATSVEIAVRLREQALKLSRSGLRMRLDQTPSSDKPEAASAAVRSSERPKESATVALLDQVESSASALLRSIGEMKQADTALDGLESVAGSLDASVERDFALSPPGKAGEVAKNLADAHKLVALMKTRARSVSADSEQLLASVSKALNTDDGSLGTSAAPAAELAPEASRALGTKKSLPKAHASVMPAKAAHASSAAARPKAASADESDAPAKPAAKPGKPVPAPRDFEP